KELPRPTIGVDSGGGLQFLWLLIVSLGPEYRARVEAISRALMVALGAKPGTQNIDRILRVPGTVNWPTPTKRDDGRVPCLSKLLWLEEGLRYSLDDFAAWETSGPGTPEDEGQHARYEGD